MKTWTNIDKFERSTKWADLNSKHVLDLTGEDMDWSTERQCTCQWFGQVDRHKAKLEHTQCYLHIHPTNMHQCHNHLIGTFSYNTRRTSTYVTSVEVRTSWLGSQYFVKQNKLVCPKFSSQAMLPTFSLPSTFYRKFQYTLNWQFTFQ